MNAQVLHLVAGPFLSPETADPGPDWGRPWETVLVPAILGERDRAAESMEALQASTPSHLQGCLLVICARAMAALGLERASHDLLDEALSQGVPEARNLAVFMNHRREDPSWTSPLPPCGERADCYADLAAARLAAGDVEGAWRAVRAGLRACPNHAELGRWRRFLTQAPPEMAIWAAAIRIEGGSPDPYACPVPTRLAIHDPQPPPFEASLSRLIQDVEHLVPCAASGWMSAERISRKLLTGAMDGCEGVPDESALGCMLSTGCVTRHFAGDEEYRELPRDHYLLELEQMADRLVGLLEENRPAVATARELWRRAKWAPPGVIAACAHLLFVYGCHFIQAAEPALYAVNWLLRETCPRSARGEGEARRALLLAWRARLFAVVGHLARATRQARLLLASYPALTEVAQMAGEILALSDETPAWRESLAG